MELTKTEAIIKFIDILKKKPGCTVERYARLMDAEPRTIYRYLHTLSESGIVVQETKNAHYRIIDSPSGSPNILRTMQLSPKEAQLLHELIYSLDGNSTLVRSLSAKLQQLFSTLMMPKTGLPAVKAEKIDNILLAMREHRQVVLHNYNSAHSSTIADRVVEPFRLGVNYHQVIAYEPAIGEVRIFKIDRIENVEVLEQEWQHTEEHIDPVIDNFGMTGPKPILVEMRLSMRAANLLVEEYPLTKKHVKNGLFREKVRAFEGIGRFILSLPGEVEVLQPKALKTYVRQQMTLFPDDIMPEPKPTPKKATTGKRGRPRKKNSATE